MILFDRLTDGVCLILDCIYCLLLGALDGGLDIPHSDKRFAGFKKDERQLDTKIHRKYIYEDHVADCMKSIADEEPEKYQFHFSGYIKKGVVADDMAALYKKVHAAIRADPTMAKSTKEAIGDRVVRDLILDHEVYQFQNVSKTAGKLITPSVEDGGCESLSRSTGHITFHATLSSRDVDCCLNPEIDFHV